MADRTVRPVGYKPDTTTHNLTLGRHSATLDGHEIGHVITGVTVSADPFNITATLELIITEFCADDEMRVMVDARTAELLQSIGWTPPKEADQ